MGGAYAGEHAQCRGQTCCLPNCAFRSAQQLMHAISLGPRGRQKHKFFCQFSEPNIELHVLCPASALCFAAVVAHSTCRILHLLLSELPLMSSTSISRAGLGGTRLQLGTPLCSLDAALIEHDCKHPGGNHSMTSGSTEAGSDEQNQAQQLQQQLHLDTMLGDSGAGLSLGEARLATK